MIRLFLITCFFLSNLMFGQHQIPANSTMFVTVNFPTNVINAKVSNPDVLDIQTQDDNIYIQYLTDDIELVKNPANLLVKTMDGYYYSIIISHTKDTTILNYFFNIQNSLNQIKSTDKDNISTPKKIDNNDNRVEIIKKGKKALQNSNALSNSSFMDLSESIINTRGFLRVRNAVRNKNIDLIHKGIYFEDNKLFFLFNIKNSSSIPYQIENFTFEISALETEKTSTQSQLITPLNIYNKVAMVEANTEVKMIFIFTPFTISKEKIFTITMTEKNGDRTLTYKITSDIFIKAKKIRKK